LLSDTVGFIRHLPHHLVEAFRSTLDEVGDADLLLHLVDTSDPDPERQLAAVHEVLEEIGAAGVPELLVLNKLDAADPITVSRLKNLHPEAVAISAVSGAGVEDLGKAIVAALPPPAVFRLEIPYARSDLVAAAHREGEVLAEKHDEHGAVLEVRLPPHAVDMFEAYVAAPS
jgi:GTP-binding protein HflX